MKKEKETTEKNVVEGVFITNDLVKGMLGTNKGDDIRRYQILNGLSNFFHMGTHSYGPIPEEYKSKNYYKDCFLKQRIPLETLNYKISTYEYFKAKLTEKCSSWFDFYGLSILPDMWAYHIKNCIIIRIFLKLNR